MQEVIFAKYLITRATMMKRVTIICNDSIEAAENLLSVPKASGDLICNDSMQVTNRMSDTICGTVIDCR
ncbi:hypothetical protein MtrunA17_Chr2g0313711 [Medicago truncatula]|uniref:Uncharacterized protein n=1 Tax=Medicago truncatula TaxID=3880 RepID=A0A396JBS8_MEDTR|nr:hypothetical protein MtrunA17_Chr2g0313711 [Medicago truncatula]